MKYISMVTVYRLVLESYLYNTSCTTIRIYGTNRKRSNQKDLSTQKAKWKNLTVFCLSELVRNIWWKLYVMTIRRVNKEINVCFFLRTEKMFRWDIGSNGTISILFNLVTRIRCLFAGWWRIAQHGWSSRYHINSKVVQGCYEKTYEVN